MERDARKKSRPGFKGVERMEPLQMSKHKLPLLSKKVRFN